MGYGILLAGYLFLLAIPLHSMGVCIEIVGYILLFRALTLLSEYQEEHRRAKVVSAMLIPMGLYSLSMQCLLWSGKSELHEKITSVTELLYTVLLAFLLLWFHFHLYRATEMQAAEVDLPDIVRQARRNRILTFVYFALSISQSYFNVPAITKYIPYAMIVSFISLIAIIWLLLNAKMIFCCYVRICLPEDLDMPMHKSKIPSVFRTKEPDDLPDPEEEKRRAREAFDAEMHAKEAARTKKNKRGKR